MITVDTVQTTNRVQSKTLDAVRRVALVIAGGTGGHIFPGLAVAQKLLDEGWQVHWLGGPAPSMESRLVPSAGIAFHCITFAGVRGKGMNTLLKLPLNLLKASVQSYKLMNALRPSVLVGMGGYITVAPCLVGRLMRVPVVLHEQNSVAGSANRLLARFAQKVFSAFPGVLGAEWVGNPLRIEFTHCEEPAERLAQRVGPLRLLVVGGSLGAQALNSVIPQALALLRPEQRPIVVHQGGDKQMQSLEQAYQAAGLNDGLNPSKSITLIPFINNVAQAFIDADIVICRAGASTVSELAALGVAAIYVPYPHAIDDHQTRNAQFMVQRGAGWLINQNALTPQVLADQLVHLTREEILVKAQCAYSQRRVGATQCVFEACEELIH